MTLSFQPWLDKIQDNFTTCMASTIVVQWSVLKNHNNRKFWSILKAILLKGTVHKMQTTITK